MTFNPYVVVVSKRSDCPSYRTIFSYFGQSPLLPITSKETVCGCGHLHRFALQLVGPLYDSDNKAWTIAEICSAQLYLSMVTSIGSLPC